MQRFLYQGKCDAGRIPPPGNPALPVVSIRGCAQFNNGLIFFTESVQIFRYPGGLSQAHWQHAAGSRIESAGVTHALLTGQAADKGYNVE
ncbi:MAG: hypothetical protein NTY79_06595 [Chloroflexi bacterium]|nr:hypothetical protein [Chloroflexota bacterium]